MTINFVDSRAGKPHIAGDDMGDFKAGIVGDAGYVLKRAEMLAATMPSANKITIGTGSVIMPSTGRHARITAPETVTIDSGTQGQKRNDIIVLRPTTSSDNSTVEKLEIVAVKGTPTTSTAADPKTNATDLKLYRIVFDGVSVSEPVALFDVMVPYSEFRDSVSQESSSGGWVIKRRPNGYVECLRSVSFKSPIATAYGSLFRSSDYAASKNYPVAFRDVPLVSIGVYSDTTIMSAADGGTQTKSPNVYAVYSSKRTTNCDIVVTIKAEGYAN